MIKFKKRSVTDNIVVQYTNTGDEVLKLRDLRHTAKLKGEIEIKANFVITKSGEVEVARDEDSVSGLDNVSVVILVVGNESTPEQLSAIENLIQVLKEKYTEATVV